MSKSERMPRKVTKSAVNETSQAELFLSRELATLEFNFRVLAQARDTGIPLLERLRYLSIVANNLDKFFEVRVAHAKTPLALPGQDVLRYGLPRRIHAAAYLHHLPHHFAIDGVDCIA